MIIKWIRATGENLMPSSIHTHPPPAESRLLKPRPGVTAEPTETDDRCMQRGSFDDVPLTTLIPGLSPTDVESLRGAARTIDSARIESTRAESRREWEWALDHAVFPGPEACTPVILGLDVVEHADGGDQLEFLLQVVWTGGGRLTVDAAVNVACWCDTDHATHDVDALSLVVGDAASLPQAFRARAQRLIGWPADPRDADHWRAEAGLPARLPS
ncbi:hypothetical protein [Streptomyces yangpuensis]|uniref:hypothetical protein n=1 Tax=Streptomyces yangpuensis TaxID=1648182 RepID=UPI003802EC86